MSISSNQQEVFFSQSEQLVSETDLNGDITYVNDEFVEISGFTREELIGQHHNIVRHPDMPSAAFEDLWAKLKSNQSWRGMVKNRCKDGRFYWVDAYVTPVKVDGKVTGYQSVRSLPTAQMIKDAQTLYQNINNGKSFGIRSEGTKFKHGVFIAVLLLISVSQYYFTQSLQSVGLQALLVIAFFAIYRDEIFKLPGYISTLKNSIDSPSRLIYSGKGLESIADYAQKLSQARLSTVLGRSDDYGKSLSTTAAELAESSSKTLDGLVVQSGHIEQLSSAITEMTYSIQEISRSTVSSEQRIEDVSKECKSTIKIIEDSRTTIGEMQDSAELAANSVTTLVDEVDSIATIMSEISGIADQTNLLALNAAIEAARAGEQGRGFAVVADEVRTLASRTQNATLKIKESVNGLQGTLAKWNEMMQTSQSQARKSHQQSGLMEEAMNSVIGIVSEVSEASLQIVATTKEQILVAEQISESVNTIEEISVGNTKLAEQTQLAGKSVREGSEAVRRLSGTFS